MEHLTPLKRLGQVFSQLQARPAGISRISTLMIADKMRSMHKPKQPLSVEIQALREAYASLNRNDIPAFVKLLDPQIEWIEADLPQGGTYRGLSAVEAHLSAARAAWAEGSCEPQRFIVVGDRIIVFLRVHVRLIHETDWREGHIADVVTFRNGKAIEKRSFTDSRQALEWAGAEASE